MPQKDMQEEEGDMQLPLLTDKKMVVGAARKDVQPKKPKRGETKGDQDSTKPQIKKVKDEATEKATQK